MCQWVTSVSAGAWSPAPSCLQYRPLESLAAALCCSCGPQMIDLIIVATSPFMVGVQGTLQCAQRLCQ